MVAKVGYCKWDKTMCPKSIEGSQSELSQRNRTVMEGGSYDKDQTWTQTLFSFISMLRQTPQFKALCYIRISSGSYDN